MSNAIVGTPSWAAMRHRSLLRATLSCLLATAAARAAPPKVPQPSDFEVPLQLSGEVTFTGPPVKFGGRVKGRCIRDEKGGPYQWTVQAELGADGPGHVTLILYAPPSSGSTDELSLMVATSTGAAMIGTIKGVPPVGKGHLTVSRAGKGAHLSVVGAGADGAKVSVQIDCESTTAT